MKWLAIYFTFFVILFLNINEQNYSIRQGVLKY